MSPFPAAPTGLNIRPPPPSSLMQAAPLVDALALAWIAFRLYEDPSTQEGFQRALDTLGRVPAFPWLLEVSPDGFASQGASIPTRRTAAVSLARGAYARGIAAFGFSAPPTAADVLTLFRVIADGLDSDEQRLAAVLAQRGATNVVVAEHGTLIGAPAGHDPGPGNRPTLVPAGEASFRLAPGAPAAEGAEVLTEYRLHEYLQRFAESDPADFWARAELAHAYLDSFSALPREQQEGLVAELLDRRREAPMRALLDQFTDTELADLTGPEEHPLLLEYLRIASEQESRPRPLLHRMTGRSAAADRSFQQLKRGLVPMGGGASARRRLENLRPGRAHHHRAGIESFRSLLALADDREAARLLRVWASRVTRALSTGDLPGAASWLEAATGNPLQPDQAAAARAELAGLLAGDLLDLLMTAAAGGTEESPGLVGMLAPFTADALIDRLAVEPDRARRRALVDLLGIMAREDPAPVLRRLDDRRWYLARNLAIALGHSRRQEAVEPLRLLSRHADHRVRREALRALRALSPVEGERAAVAALDDPDPTVRILALTVLAHAGDAAVDHLLARRLAAWPPAEEAAGIIEALTRRGSRTARAALEDLARRRLLLSSPKRKTREAARRALGKGKR